MKRILALTLSMVMLISSSLCVFAAESTSATTTGGDQGSLSRQVRDLMDTVEKMSKDHEKETQELRNAIAELTRAVNAKGSHSSGGGGSKQTQAASTPSNSNYVNFGGTVTYQGGKIEINGGRSNVTFTIAAPSSSVISSAGTLAGKVGGTLVSCISTSSPGVGFKTAKVNFYVGGVQNGDNIAVYQNQNGTWVQLPVVEIRQDHVVVNMTRHGDIAFVRVPVLASITG
ncbi:MAG: hypothetical protein E7305_00745 [Butyrivibrio sp.]|jgi:hypothetical protein|nr:hypothetical protein [Butyrivibrio sp.]